jgi:ribosome-interacting GTPase 1
LPANLSPEAKAKWKVALAARNPREKLQAYQEFLSTIPKHKGNERLQAQVKTKIATLKEELLAQRGRHGGSRSSWYVEREGAAQVMLFGPTNAGRSSLLRAITNAQVTVADYGYTTQRPVPGMLSYEDIQLQLVELPAPQINSEGKLEIQPEEVDLIRASDGLMLVVDLSTEPVQQLNSLLATLQEVRISTTRGSSRVEIVSEKGSGEIRIASSGVQTSCTPAQIRDLLHSYGIKNALVRIYGDSSISDVEDAIFENVTKYKPSIVVANKMDLARARQNSVDFNANMPVPLPVVFTSCLTGQNLRTIGELIFQTLGLIRVYTKEPNQIKPSDHPFVVKTGTTVRELARNIHSDLANRYRYSRIWGPTSKFAGERVGPDHVLGDRDVVEIHTG